jgi:glycosyltransferase involved in cell wall biosynthesis
MSVLTGIQRVIREAHEHLVDLLALSGIDLAPLTTREPPEDRRRSRLDYLRTDPVTTLPLKCLAEVDAILMMDLNLGVDFSAIHQARRQRRLPTVCVVHDVMPLRNPEWFALGGAKSFRIYLQQVLRVADHIIVTTDKVKKDLQDIGWSIPAEIHVVPLGTSFDPRAPTLMPDQRISLMYVSTIEPRKGHDVLVAAFDMLRAEGRDVDLTLVGRKGWNSGDFFAKIINHPDFGGRLKWLQSADDLTVEAVARECSIGVVPAKDEGFGLFVEEGLSLGLKVVASAVPVFVERKQPNLFFAGPDPDDWARAILDAHHQPWQSSDLSSIRTMEAFAGELADLVVKAVR